jgi:Asp-tRNA(Asn)/Glu-tRNA(Gln) amidotransferase A subunit family amidase
MDFRLAKKRISASEAIEAAIARARSINPGISAIVTETFDAARIR